MYFIYFTKHIKSEHKYNDYYGIITKFVPEIEIL